MGQRRGPPRSIPGNRADVLSDLSEAQEAALAEGTAALAAITRREVHWWDVTALRTTFTCLAISVDVAARVRSGEPLAVAIESACTDADMPKPTYLAQLRRWGCRPNYES
jgi:hypothetical protein